MSTAESTELSHGEAPPEVYGDDQAPLFLDDITETSVTTSETSDGITPWQVMVVDDDKDVHTLTSMVFSGVKFEDRPIEFIHAYSGKECIELLESNGTIAMVLLDVVMESVDAGFKVVKEIRDVLDNQLVRIVLRTGQPGVAPEESVILDYDINDYVAKTEPFSRLLTCVVTGLRSFRDLQIRRQFNLAAALEEHMFTRTLPDISRYEFYAKKQSALQTGGDFYELQSISDREVVIVIGDVSGKGLPASLYVSATLGMLRTQVECYTSMGRNEMLRPAAILKNLNRLLLKTMQRGKFVTMFVATLDTRTHQLTYATAGHCACYVVTPGQPETPQVLKSAGMVCGLCGAPFDKMIKEQVIDLQPGSYVMLNTDGLTEATDVNGLQFGDDRYLESVADIEQDSSAIEATNKVWNDVMDHLDHGELSDDCTMVCIRRK